MFEKEMGRKNCFLIISHKVQETGRILANLGRRALIDRTLDGPENHHCWPGEKALKIRGFQREPWFKVGYRATERMSPSSAHRTLGDLVFTVPHRMYF